ncbi:MAG: hypothetical protein ACTSPQ_18310 [Candidatus Helarchaeota archaeon]
MDGGKEIMSKKPRQLFKERNKRVMDAISLKKPDRVPITPMSTFYPTEQKGISKKDALYNPKLAVEAAIEVFSQELHARKIDLKIINLTSSSKENI